MAIYNQDQKKDIIFNNPNKALIQKAQKDSKKLMMHLRGTGLKSADCMKRDTYFESEEIYTARTSRPISNKDLFKRTLEAEELVFTARGGSCNWTVDSDDKKKQMNAYTADVRYGMSLHAWVKTFALNAYRADPMGLIFMEINTTAEVDEEEPAAYPTYKSIQSVFDYLPNGRSLEYVCFQLTVQDCQQFGISDAELDSSIPQNATIGQLQKKTQYYRFCDDQDDTIYKKTNDTIVLVVQKDLENPIASKWQKLPAFIVSDLISFDDPQYFNSPLDYIVELADCYLYDRSVRDLQKKYHGFAKAYEPMLKCSTCSGIGAIKGIACPDCTPAGADRGTGYKLKTKPSDVAKFPLEMLKDTPSLDISKIFGYVTAPIETWNKQDQSLTGYEDEIFSTYWGTEREHGNNVRSINSTLSSDNTQETATKTLVNLQPKYARLNVTADWAERTESMIANLIGEYYFQTAWKGGSVSYGRNYILETPNDLMEQYFEMRTNGVADFLLDEAMERYLRALYQSNPTRLALYLNLMKVEPFVHTKVDACIKPTDPPALGLVVIPTLKDYYAKKYFGEWLTTVDDSYIINNKPVDLRKELDTYVTALNIQEPEKPAPIVPAQIDKPIPKAA